VSSLETFEGTESMSYQTLIHQIAPAANPRHVEAWLRIEHGTLDHLSRDRFKEEVAIALECIAAATPEQSEQLAMSYGL
jgi:hypothetical protein